MKQIKPSKINIVTFLFCLTIFISFIPKFGYAQSDSQGIYEELTQKLFPNNLKKSYPVAVCPLNSSSDGLEPFARLVTERLTNTLVASNKCIVVERANLNQILAEVKLGLTGAISQQTAAKIGNLLGAKLIVTGTVERDKSEIHIIIRLINVESGQIESSADFSFSTNLNNSGKTEQNDIAYNDRNKSSLTKSVKLYFASLGEDGDENKSPLDLLTMNLINGPIINIDKERNSLRDKIAIIDEKEKTNPSAELSAEKSRLDKELRACNIMIRGVDALIQNKETDTFQASFKQAKELSPHNPNLMLFDSFLNMDDNNAIKKKIDEILLISSTCAEAYLFRAFWGNEELSSQREKKTIRGSLSDTQKKERDIRLLKNILTDTDRYALYCGDALGANSYKIYTLLCANKENDADVLIRKAVADNSAYNSLYGDRAHYYLLRGTVWGSPIFKEGENKKLYIEGQKFIDKAIEDFSTMVALDPPGIAGRYERAYLYRTYKEDYAKAISDLTKLIEIDSSKAWEYLFDRGYCYKSMGQMEEAVKDWKQSIDKKPGYIVPLNELANYYLQLKDSVNVLKYIDLYLKCDEKKHDLRYVDWIEIKMTDFVELLCKNGQCQKAEDLFNKVCLIKGVNIQILKKEYGVNRTSLDNELPVAFESLAGCYENAGNINEAIELYQNGISMINQTIENGFKNDKEREVPKSYDYNDHKNLGRFYGSLGSLRLRRKEYRDALNDYNLAIEAFETNDPNNPFPGHDMAYYGRAFCYLHFGEKEKANSDMKKACDLGFREACDYLKSQ